MWNALQDVDEPYPQKQSPLQVKPSHPFASLSIRLLLLRRRGSSSSSSSSSLPLSIPLLRIEHGLQLGRGLEPGVIGVLLVEVVVGLGTELGGQLLEDAGEDAVDGLLLGGVAVPDGDVVGVEADGETDAAELVAWKGEGIAVSRLSFFSPSSSTSSFPLQRTYQRLAHSQTSRQ